MRLELWEVRCRWQWADEVLSDLCIFFFPCTKKEEDEEDVRGIKSSTWYIE